MACVLCNPAGRVSDAGFPPQGGFMLWVVGYTHHQVLRTSYSRGRSVMWCAGQLTPANSASVPSRMHSMHSMVSSSSFLGLPAALSRASSQALPPGYPPSGPSPQPNLSKWRPLSWRASSRSLASSASISSSPSSSSLPALPPDALMRKPFVLRMVSSATRGVCTICHCQVFCDCVFQGRVVSTLGWQHLYNGARHSWPA